MRTITISGGQTLLDIAMQHVGDASRVFEIAELNGLNITDDLEPGATLKVPDTAIDREYIVNAFKSKDLHPASSDDPRPVDEGIDYWAIEEDFIVQDN